MFASLLCFVLAVRTVHGLSPRIPSTTTSSSSSTTHKTSSTPFLPFPIHTFDPMGSWFAFNEEGAFDEDTFGVAFPMALASTASLGMNPYDWMDSLCHFAKTGSLDTTTDFQTEALSFVSHFVSDLLIIAAPALPCLSLRIAAVLGRLLSIAADYIPDHMVLPDELIFQVFMLTLSWGALVQTLLPKIFAATTLPRTYQIRDGKAYAALFEPTGMTWEQFKSLSACAMDWVHVAPHQEILTTTTTSNIPMDRNDLVEEGAKCAYWLYRGSMTITNSQGTTLYTHTSKGGGRQFKQAAFRGILGESALINCLEKVRNGSKTRSRSTPFPRTIPDTKTHAGPTGATILRIHASQLARLTEQDEGLASCVRVLLFQGLASKLRGQFGQQSSPLTDGENQYHSL